MNSIVLCEGNDDLWFIAYYLNKTSGWDECKTPKKFFPLYEVKPLNKKQSVKYFSKNSDCVSIWSVSGKDAFSDAISTIINKLVAEYPSASPASIVLVRDRDEDEEKDILGGFERCFSDKVKLINAMPCIYHDVVDDEDVNINVTPIILPFDCNGAIETLLLNSIRDSDEEGKTIATEAEAYIDRLISSPKVGIKYLNKARLAVKARYSAAVAATNPDHSTELFQRMVYSCPWEESEYVKKHFDIILKSITDGSIR